MEPAGRQSFPPAEAGAVLVTVTLVCLGVGALIGWSAGHLGIGILVGAVIGVPLGVGGVYYRYRDSFR
jgi:hypothetical protein